MISLDMLKLNFCCILVLFVQIVTYQQSDYIVIWERGEVSSANKHHVPFATVKNFKYNRTHLASNLTYKFNTNFGYRLQVEVQAYKFASNEYRQFPLGFAFNFCSIADKNEYGLQNLYACGNFTTCPMVKGLFVICNWTPDYSKFPPFIPPGRYMLNLKYLYLGKEVMGTEGYFTVQRVKDFSP